MKNKYLQILFAIFISMSIFGCAGYMHGYTKSKSFNKYLLVDRKSENFGYKRMQYIQDFRPPLKGFVKKHGIPDFIYEFKTENGREGIKMFYVNKDIAYVFIEDNWRPSSIFLSEHRKLTDYEKLTYKELIKSSSSE